MDRAPRSVSHVCLRSLRNCGDHWVFQLLIDRVALIFPLVVALHFRMYELGVFLFGAFVVGVISPLLLTTSNRDGLCVALDCLVRARWPEGNDPLPKPDSGAN